MWNSGAARIPFGELLTYFERHPALSGIEASLSGLPALKTEFGTLSRAVHGSAQGFRMTKDSKHILLWSSARDRLGPWLTREGAVLFGVNSLLTTLYRDVLAGTAMPGLRKAVSMAIPGAAGAKFKQLGVSFE